MQRVSGRCLFIKHSAANIHINSFGFAKFKEVRDSEKCIIGFYHLGYEVGFARVSVYVSVLERAFLY